MSDDGELGDTVARMLASETFEPDELCEVLVARGHDEATVRAAIDRALAEIDDAERSPAVQRAQGHARRGRRLVRAGVFVLAVGLGVALIMQRGILELLLVIAVGGALVGAGYRTLAYAAPPVRRRRS